VLPALLERAAGKGGGSADMLQIAPADAAHAEAAWRHAVDAIRELVGMGEVA